MKFAVRQSFVEILSIDRRNNRVSAAGNDLHRRLYARQNISEYFKLGRVRLNVAHRFRESIAFERGQIVLACRVTEHIAFDLMNHLLDDRASTEPSIWFEVGREHPFA